MLEKTNNPIKTALKFTKTISWFNYSANLQTIIAQICRQFKQNFWFFYYFFKVQNYF